MFAHIKYALRILAKSPGFSAIAILTLVLGIGANSAIFSVVDAVLLRPLPFPNANELVAIWARVPRENAERDAESYLNYTDVRDQSKTLSGLTAFTRAGGVLTGQNELREIRGLAVTSDIFQVIGVAPLMGRGFTREEDNRDARVVVLSYRAWKSWFNGDSEIVGKQIGISWRQYTVLGVMPQGFQYPIEREQADYYMPLHPLVTDQLDHRDSHFLTLVGRLRPGATIKQCDAEVKGLAARLAQQYPDTNTGRSLRALALHDDMVGEVKPALMTILAAVVVVLLIACANVANLLLARATARQREIAIKTALGASRARIVAQLLFEGFLLAVFGAVGGLLLAWWAVDFLRLFGPQDLPRLGEISVNRSVFLFTAVMTIASTLLCALMPALQVTRAELTQSLQEGGRGGASRETHRLRGLLVVSQIALSLLLLVGAGLLIKSFANLRATAPGFEPTHASAIDLVVPKVKYPEIDQQRQFFVDIVPQLAALPGVEIAGGVTPMPFSGNQSGRTFSIAGQPPIPVGEHPSASHLAVTPNYFKAMQIPLRQGRDFDAHDDAASRPVIIVNEAFVRRFLPNVQPLGQQIIIDGFDIKDSKAREIVGVVGNTHHDSLSADPEPEFCVPHAQDPGRRLYVVFRTTGREIAGLQRAIANVVHQRDKDIFIPEIERLEYLVSQTLAQPKFNTLLLGSFAAVAMILAGIGIYGVIAYSVAQRTREIGIRMALGAQRRDMLTMILWQSSQLVLVGLGVGLVASFLGTRLIASLLYGVGASDALTYLAVIFLLGFCALIASLVPARRAMKVDPMIALRYE